MPCRTVDDDHLLDHACGDVEQKAEISGCYAEGDRPRRSGR